MTGRHRPREEQEESWFFHPELMPQPEKLCMEAERDRETAAIMPPYEPRDLMANRARHDREKKA